MKNMIKNPVTNEQRENLLISALEGGSNYWYLLDKLACEVINKHCPKDGKTPLSIRMWNALKVGAVIPNSDLESEEVLGDISMDKIHEGEALMVEKYAHHFADIIAESDDAITADVWFQLAVMKDIIYG